MLYYCCRRLSLLPTLSHFLSHSHTHPPFPNTSHALHLCQPLPSLPIIHTQLEQGHCVCLRQFQLPLNATNYGKYIEGPFQAHSTFGMKVKKKHCWLLLEKKHIQGCILPRRLFPINYVNLNRRTSFDWKAHLKYIFITQLQLFQASVRFPHLSMHSVFIAHVICTNNMLTE